MKQLEEHLSHEASDGLGEGFASVPLPVASGVGKEPGNS